MAGEDGLYEEKTLTALETAMAAVGFATADWDVDDNGFRHTESPVEGYGKFVIKGGVSAAQLKEMLDLPLDLNEDTYSFAIFTISDSGSRARRQTEFRSMLSLRRTNGKMSMMH